MVVMVQTSNGSNRAQSKSSPVKTQQRLLLNTRKSLFQGRAGNRDLKSKTRNKSRFSSKLVSPDKKSGDKKLLHWSDRTIRLCEEKSSIIARSGIPLWCI